jgi:hypothetical protein
MESSHELLHLPIICPDLKDTTTLTEQQGKNYTHNRGIGTPSEEGGLQLWSKMASNEWGAGVTAILQIMLRFQILTVVSMKMTAFWDIIPCTLVILMMVAVGISQASVYYVLFLCSCKMYTMFCKMLPAPQIYVLGQKYLFTNFHSFFIKPGVPLNSKGKKKVKQSRYMPWRRLGGEEV